MDTQHGVERKTKHSFAVAILVGIPALYLLSFGPMLAMLQEKFSRGKLSVGEREAFQKIYAPAIKMSYSPVTGDLLDWYVMLWGARPPGWED